MTSQQQRFFADKVLPFADKVEKWRPHLVDLLRQLEEASAEDWANEGFLRDLWASEAVSNTGQGKVSIDIALADEPFRRWFGTTAQAARRLRGLEQIDALKALFDELIEKFKELGLPRLPRLKINRVLAALAPDRLTTLANPGTRVEMFRWVTGKSEKGVHPIDQQVEIRRVIDELANPYPNLRDSANLTTFMLPWIAFESLREDRLQAQTGTNDGTETRVSLQNNSTPTKTFFAIGGGIQRLLEICDMVELAPLSDEDLYESLQERYPWNYPWAKQMANFLANSVGVLSRDDGTFQLSSLGSEFLRKKSGDVLADRLVRNFIGVDHILVALKDGSRPKSELIPLLRRVNTRAQSDFGPNTTLSWLVSLGAISLSKGEYSLTPSGYNWAELVKWTPTGAESAEEVAPQTIDSTAVETELPEWNQVRAHFAATAAADSMTFDESKVFEIHSGLWNGSVRHFCILTGLSGAGKTQIAVRYANAVVAAVGEDSSCVEIIPVQPDWAEPSHLLGFRHPIDSSRYQSTQFLKILLRAHDNPTKPHFAILDEMNLAHPELYLAPILSAMETESDLWLHQSDEVPSQGIPGTVRYPRNLAIIGTVNIDETTHSLSYKVMDRAEVVDFSEVDLNAFQWSSYTALGDRLKVIRAVLTALYDALLPVRLHFAYRVVKSILDRVLFAIGQLGDEVADNWISLFDDAVASKVLPKLRGEDSKELRSAMDLICTVLSDAGLSKCSRRVDTLRIELARDGVLKYWR